MHSRTRCPGHYGDIDVAAHGAHRSPDGLFTGRIHLLFKLSRQQRRWVVAVPNRLHVTTATRGTHYTIVRLHNPPQNVSFLSASTVHCANLRQSIISSIRPSRQLRHTLIEVMKRANQAVITIAFFHPIGTFFDVSQQRRTHTLHLALRETRLHDQLGRIPDPHATST